MYHLMYADDIVLLIPSATGLSLLLHVCGKYGLEHDIRFNSKKSAVIIFRNSFVKDFSYPSFVMNGESIKEVPFVKYLGHVISADMKDDLDIMRHCRQLYAQGSCSSFSYVLGQCESYYFSLLLFFLVHIATVVEIQG